MLLAVPLAAGGAHATLATVLPGVHGHPLATAEAVVVAMKVVGVAVAQRAAEELVFQFFPVVLELFCLGVLRFNPPVFPVLEGLRVGLDVGPRLVIIQQHVHHEVDVELFYVRLVREPGCETGVRVAGLGKPGGGAEEGRQVLEGVPAGRSAGAVLTTPASIFTTGTRCAGLFLPAPFLTRALGFWRVRGFVRLVGFHSHVLR